MFNIFALAGAGGGVNSGGISSGGPFDDSGMILPGLTDFVEIFGNWLESLAGFWNALNVPLGDLFAGVPTIDGYVPGGLSGIVHMFGLQDVTLLGLILGGSLGFYVVYQLTTWFLNLIT